MKYSAIKSLLKRTAAIMLLLVGSVSASAQYYMNVVQKDGKIVQYLVSDIDNVFFSGKDGSGEKYEFVDLGLSVKWATYNVGANSPEEYGDYYAWGETEIKTSYTWTNYKFRTSGDSYNTVKFSKYTDVSYYGPVDNKTILESEDDVAHVKRGGSWRIPTIVEFEELKNNCTWTWTTLDGINGYRVTSNKAGYTDRSIFLPAAGLVGQKYRDRAGSYGHYWSSSSQIFDVYSRGQARSLDFDSVRVQLLGAYRYCGLSVRPVCPNETYSSVPTDVQLSFTSILLLTGTKLQLTATVKDQNYIELDFPVEWSSNNPSVATVSNDGTVTTISEGLAVITATADTANAECVITVENLSSTGVENGYEYVDLGLSVKWATYNVGASSPEEYGDYYAWGETETKTEYDWSTYKWCNGSSTTLTKYNTDSLRGSVDNMTVLEPEDDVAHVKWGGSWRMPTDAEQYDLKWNCTWVRITLNGVDGYRVTSKIEGYTDRSIFLPAAGIYNSSLNDVGSNGLFWSRCLNTSSYSYTSYACYIDFISDFVRVDGSGRNSGKSVRPVCPYESADVLLSNASIRISTGDTFQLSAIVKNQSGHVINNPVEWSSNNPSVATVDNDGTVTAISAGTTIITATADTVNAECMVTVDSLSFTGVENGYEYVDLGLSVKWATYNVGASSPEEYGDDYAWGETETKTVNDWSTYKWCNGSSTTLTKYNTDSLRGSVDNMTVLEPEDDVAHVKWGGSWRMPTDAERNELRTNCTWIWITRNGVNGYRVISNIEGYTDCSIFLPADGNSGQYWSSSPSLSGAFFLFFYSDRVEWGIGDRCRPRSVRPVCP